MTYSVASPRFNTATLTTRVTVEFPVYINCTYQNERYDEHDVARHGYAIDTPFIDTPRQTRPHYSKRFGIKSIYRLSEKTTISTTT